MPMKIGESVAQKMQDAYDAFKTALDNIVASSSEIDKKLEDALNYSPNDGICAKLDQFMVNFTEEFLDLAKEIEEHQLVAGYLDGTISEEELNPETLSKLKFDESLRPSNDLSEEDINKIKDAADALDIAGMIKEASVLDEILFTIASPKDGVQKFSQKMYEDLEKARAKFHNKKNLYDNKEFFAEGANAKEIEKQVDKQVKQYRPLEAPMTTRYCPDHPGESTTRIADNVYQCVLDNKIYDFSEGFTTMNGNKIPGTVPQNQTAFSSQSVNDQVAFSSRESMSNSS